MSNSNQLEPCERMITARLQGNQIGTTVVQVNTTTEDAIEDEKISSIKNYTKQPWSYAAYWRYECTDR